MKATMRRNTSRRHSSTLVSAAATLGGALSLVGSPAFALELGEIQVESTLGQPLRASVGFTLNANEQMFDFCVRLRQGLDGGPIPSVSRANVAIVGNRIVFTGDAAIKDPLLSMQVIVDCPYTPHLRRQYTLVVDPVEFVENNVFLVDEPAPAATTPIATAPVAQNIQVIETPVVAEPVTVARDDRSPIEMNAEYRVQSGDSVSAIASRIEGRTNSLRSAISILVASNPDVFPDGNAEMLMAGSVLVIPPMTAEFDAGENIARPVVTNVREFAPLPAQAEPETVSSLTLPAPVEEPVAATAEQIPEPPAEVEEPVAAVEKEPPTLVADTDVAPPEETADAEATAEAAEETVVTTISESSTQIDTGSADGELQPGDIVVAAPAESATMETAELTAPVVTAPVVSTADSSASGSNDSWAWLSWPVGGALLLVGGILLFGRQLRRIFGSVAVGDPQEPAPSPETQMEVDAEALPATADESQTQETEQNEAPAPAIENVDFEVDDTINSDAISLDADLDAGTGLGDSGEIDVAQDFSFAASGQVEQVIDHEIPEEASREPEKPETEIIPPTHKEVEPSILESEVTPEDDYDMSMIVDATKQSIGDTQLTAQDLQAVPVDLDLGSSDSYSISDDTLASDADLEALEQDYQEEFTQTQALNKEIEQAAQELAAKLDDDMADDDPTGDEPVLTIGDPGLDPTAEMPASQPEDELTTEMPAHSSENEATSEMPGQSSAAEVTAELAANIDAENDDVAEDSSDDEVTSRLAAAGNDPTVEMQIETVIADLDDDK